MNAAEVEAPSARELGVPADAWAASIAQDIARAGLEARLQQWVKLCDAVFDGDYEFKMSAATAPKGTPVTTNPWLERFKLLAAMGQLLVEELATWEAAHGVVAGAEGFREAFAETDAEAKAIDSLAKRPPLDWAKIMANMVPPSKEWFDREHELSDEDRKC